MSMLAMTVISRFNFSEFQQNHILLLKIDNIFNAFDRLDFNCDHPID